MPKYEAGKTSVLDKYGDGYGDDLMGDDEDRNWLLAMPEVEREKELMKRLEKREILKTRMDIKRILLEENQRENSELAAKKASVSVLKASEVFDDEQACSSPAGLSPTDLSSKKALTACSFDQIQQLRLSRFRLASWVYMPFFNEKVVDAFVRVSIKTAASKTTVYKVGQIAAVVESSKIYKLTEEIYTNKALVLNVADQKLTLRIEFVSNQPFTEMELLDWKEDMDGNNISMPSIFLFERKMAELQWCREFQPNDKDIDYMVAQKMRFRRAPVNYTIAKHSLINQAILCEQKGETVKAEKLRSMAKQLDSQADKFHKDRNKKLEKIYQINQRNMKRMTDELEEMLQKEYEENARKNVALTEQKNLDDMEKLFDFDICLEIKDERFDRLQL